MEFRQLKTFSAIARLGSFVQAARTLGYAQSSITSQIQALEAELGTRLFDRLGHRVCLTGQGRTLLAYVDQIVKLCDEAQAAVSDQGEPQGTLTIGTGESLSTYRLPALFQDFRGRYPAVEMVLKFANCSTLRELIRRNEVDAGLFLDRRISDADLQVEVLAAAEIVFMVAPGHVLAAQATVIPRDLADECVILTEPGCSLRRTVEGILAAYEVKPRSYLEVSSVESIKQFTMIGLGVSMLPRFVAAQELAEGRLVTVAWQDPLPEFYVQAVCHKDKWLSPALRAFLLATRTLLISPPTLPREAELVPSGESASGSGDRTDGVLSHAGPA